MSLFSLASWTWLWETINGLFLIICNWIYVLIGLLYQVFEAVAKVNLFGKDTFAEITSRIYVIIGIAMLFIFAYNIILMIINPEDKKATGNTGKLVKETIISFSLIILLPTIFDYMFRFQNNILESNIIGQVILGSVGSTSDASSSCDADDYDCTCDFGGYNLTNYRISKKWARDPKENVIDDLEDMCKDYKGYNDSVRGAYSVGSILMSAFYKPTNFTFDDCVKYVQTGSSSKIEGDDEQVCVNYFYDVTASKYTGNVSPFVLDSYLKNVVSDSKKDLMEFNALMAILAGVLGAWMFLCYAMEIGVRVAKLGVLQLLSPIAVMMRIVPKQKEGIYDKWLKNLTNTYLDVFIRLIIIYFSLFAISLVPDVIDNLFASLGSSSGSGAFSTFTIRTLALVVVILGILKFAQEAPDLIKEFFGSGGKFALKSPKKQLSDNKYAMGTIGAGAAMVKTGVGNYVRARNERLEAIQNDPNRDPNKKITRFTGMGAGIKSGLAGMVSGGVRGFNEGKKTTDFDNMEGAVNRAKAESDKKYYARRDRQLKREEFIEKHGSDFADQIGAEHTGFARSVASAVGVAFNKDAYKETVSGVGRKIDETTTRWAGSGAMNDAKRSANTEVKGYASTTMDAIDSQTKGIVKSYEEQRDERIRQARPEEIPDIRKKYSKLIETARSETIKTMDSSAFENLQQSLENLCDSIKANQNYLEHFTGENGTLPDIIKSIEKDATITEKLTPEFKKIFEGSLDDFATGMKEVLADKAKFDALSKADRIAIVSAVDKITKTTDNNLRGIANESKKPIDKK